MKALTRYKLEQQADTLAEAYNKAESDYAKRLIKKQRKLVLRQLDPARPWRWLSYILFAGLMLISVYALEHQIAADAYKGMALEFCLSVAEEQACREVVR